MLAEVAEGALDGVALPIGGGVEGGQAAALAAPLQPVFRLVRGFGDGRLNLAAAQVRADRGAGVRLIAQDPPRAGSAAVPRARPGDLELIRRPGPRPASRAAARRWSDLPGQQRAHRRSASRWILLVSPPRDRPSASRFLSFGLCPSRGPGRSAAPSPAAPDPHQPAAGAAPRPHAGAPAPRSHPPRPSAPGPRPDRTRPAAGPRIISQVPSPDQRRCRSYKPSSSSRTAPADPATGSPRTGPVEDPVNHQPVIIPPGAPAADARAAAAPAAPTHHRSGHAASACTSSTRPSKRKRPTKIYGTRPSRVPDPAGRSWPCPSPFFSAPLSPGDQWHHRGGPVLPGAWCSHRAVGLDNLGAPGRRIGLAGRVAEVDLPQVSGGFRRRSC